MIFHRTGHWQLYHAFQRNGALDETTKHVTPNNITMVLSLFRLRLRKRQHR